MMLTASCWLILKQYHKGRNTSEIITCSIYEKWKATVFVISPYTKRLTIGSLIMCGSIINNKFQQRSEINVKTIDTIRLCLHYQSCNWSSIRR